MKLLLISPRYFPHIGGVEYVVKSVAERLAGRGYDVHVLCGESSIDKPKEETVNGVSIVRWPVWALGDAYHIPRMRSKLKSWLSDAVKDCDVVHFHSVHSVLTMYSLGVLKDYGVRKVLTPYYHGAGHTFFRRFLWKGWRSHVRGLMRFVDAVHTVSRLEAQLVKRDFKVDAITIENGVDEWVLNVPWAPSNFVMYSGRIEKYKNIHRLANIVKILNTNYGLDLGLRIYGSGPYMSGLSKHLSNLAIKYSINPPRLFKKYIETLSKASLFGLLSEKESYPQSVNEANAIGVPVIIAEPWGNNFLSRNRTLIVRLGESDKTIAEKIVAFLRECTYQPRSHVSSWSLVAGVYTRILYSQ